MSLHAHPLEIWNRLVHSYDRIPDGPSSSTSSERSSEYSSLIENLKPQRQHQRQRRRGRLLLLATFSVLSVACVFGLLGLSSRKGPGEDDDNDLSHQENILPTLLSVVDPDTDTYIYLWNHTVYDRLHTSTIIWNVQESELKDHELPKLLLDKTQITIQQSSNSNKNPIDEDDESITLTWTMGRDLETGNVMIQQEDIIALYCGDDDADEDGIFLEAATIQQIRATSIKHGGYEDSWYIPKFPILRQETCHFRLYSTIFIVASSEQQQQQQQLVHVASSEVLQISLAKETPTAIHLALADNDGDPSKMLVQFTTGAIENATPVVRVAEKSSIQKHKEFVLFQGTSNTYVADDLCQAPANLTEAGKFYPPGILHTVELHGLQPNTKYNYQVGLLQKESVLVWSDVSTFISSPEPGDADEFSYIVYGDQGCPYSGWAEGEAWLAAMAEREDARSVHHFGDISYARGAAHVWDAWFQMIQPFATQMPLMVGIGNHEYDHTDGGAHGKDPSGVRSAYGFMPSWGNFADDSGGECGVTMSKRFQMPSSSQSRNSNSNSNGVFWYSYSYASVHTTVISSEHDLTPGSPQYEFLQADLKSVDRSITPWLILESHRPLYEGEGGDHWWANKLVGEAMRGEIEHLLKEYKVDVVFAGHYHEYHRTCDGVYKGKCDMGGPIHITLGSAGARLDDGVEFENPWTARYIRGMFGYGRVTIANNTDMHLQFVRHGRINDPLAGDIHDDVWIHRDRP